MFSGGGSLFPREIFVHTSEQGAPIKLTVGGEEASFAADFTTPTATIGEAGKLSVTTTLTPLHDGARLKTADSAVAAQLKALGYIE